MLPIPILFPRRPNSVLTYYRCGGEEEYSAGPSPPPTRSSRYPRSPRTYPDPIRDGFRIPPSELPRGGIGGRGKRGIAALPPLHVLPDPPTPSRILSGRISNSSLETGERGGPEERAVGKNEEYPRAPFAPFFQIAQFRQSSPHSYKRRGRREQRQHRGKQGISVLSSPNKRLVAQVFVFRS